MLSFRSFPVLVALWAAAAGSAAEELAVRNLMIGHGSLCVEVAQSERQMARGLMQRKSLPADAGMLFTFKEPRQVSMWMKDTWISLDAAFVDACGKVVRIARMEPLTLSLHDSGEPVMNVIEANAGWFKAHGATAGTIIPELISPYCRRP